MLKKILSENNHDAIIASIGFTTSGTSITDVYTTTVPTKLRLNTSKNGLKAGAWLYIEVK